MWGDKGGTKVRKVIHKAFVTDMGWYINLCTKKVNNSPCFNLWKRVTCKKCLKLKPKQFIKDTPK